MRKKQVSFIVEGVLVCVFVLSLALYPQVTQKTQLPDVETWNDVIVYQMAFELTPTNSSLSFSITSAPGGDATAKFLCQSSFLSNSSFSVTVLRDLENTNFTEMIVANGSQQEQIFSLSNDHGDFTAPVTFTLSMTTLTGHVLGSVAVLGINPGYRIYGPGASVIRLMTGLFLRLVSILSGITIFLLAVYLFIRRKEILKPS
ncbi:MAG: hypothetical protein ACW97Z_17760 [Candidatus Hodarchaeales archaeon]